MATTTNYGWDTPDNSGLVKNGAQDIRTLGSAIDTSLWNIGFGQAGKNRLINGDFNIWQRGTTFNAITGGQYTADRWTGNFINGTINVTRQNFTAGSAPVAGYESQYFMQLARTSTHGSLSDFFAQRVEDVRTFAGQTVTVSYWARVTSGTPTLGVLITQSFGSGGSGEVSTATVDNTLSTTWTRYSATIAVPSMTGKTIGTGSWMSPAFVIPVSAGNVTLQLWGVQVEYGSKATPFETATGTIQGELAACQRYYYQMASGADTHFANGNYNTGTLLRAMISFPVAMRITPSVVATTGTDFYQAMSFAAADNFNSVNFANGNANGVSIFNNTEMAGTGGQGCIVKTNNASASVAFSAEL